jgi:hypothetical protein
MRKLILLALAGALVAYLIRNRSEPQPAWSPTEAATSGYAPGPESAAEAPPTEEVTPEPEDEDAEIIAAGEADTLETDALKRDASEQEDGS